MAQLATDDVEEVDGVPCFQIRANKSWQKLKTSGSRRTVPVHPFLIELGFLDYVTAIKRGAHERLFPYLQSGSNGFHSSSSRRFNRRLRALSIKPSRPDAKKDSYSFRHTFGTRLAEAEVPDAMISELMGHEHQTMTRKVYVNRPSARQRLKAVSRLDLREQLNGLLRGR